MDLSREEKIAYTKKAGIEFKESPEYPVDELYKLALVKDLVSKRLNDAQECFGTFDEKDQGCSKCYLSETKQCQRYQSYGVHLQNFNNQPNLIQVVLKNNREIKISMENIEVYLKKVGYRDSSLSYRIAKLILESDAKSYSDLIKDISVICGDRININYPKQRFSSIRRRIEERTDLRIGIYTQKFIHVTKSVPSEEIK